jgi:Cupredoxin-like domain
MQRDSFPPRAVVAMPAFVALSLLGAAIIFPSKSVNAQQSASVSISVKDHRFQPAQLSAPANRPLSINVKNLDTTPMEFESVSLRVEKVIAPGSEGTVNVRALAPGRYEFFDDFHQDTRGTLIVQ